MNTAIHWFLRFTVQCTLYYLLNSLPLRTLLGINAYTFINTHMVLKNSQQDCIIQDMYYMIDAPQQQYVIFRETKGKHGVHVHTFAAAGICSNSAFASCRHQMMP